MMKRVLMIDTLNHVIGHRVDEVHIILDKKLTDKLREFLNEEDGLVQFDRWLGEIERILV